MPPVPTRDAPAVPGVPWIATWSRERISTNLLESRLPGGLFYFNEGPGDRDKFGALWARQAQRIGHGAAELAGIHPRRQRQAMEQLLCQVCGLGADTSELGVLWMEPVVPGASICPSSTHPPVCVPCAMESRERCPRIRRTGVHIFRVASPMPEGVIGTHYYPGLDGTLVPDGSMEVRYEDSEVKWVLAHQMITALTGITPVDLDEEYARYLATDPEPRVASVRSTASRRCPRQAISDHRTTSPTT
ncbi:hypothetical protein [Streptomyces coffeae]|uniref:Uncharacterized protein n=1 Tax=Streptomyces coffeae TaxID=621382 RepID=A0ABS1NHH6_9ACTN|nr:hypothetical protein [Streptomyces coffeae]MBL1099503.1 hypothetical protein [Streptomyces coffeae]